MVFAILSALVAVYIILAIVAFFAQRSMLFPAPRASQEPEMRGSSLHRIPARNGITVFALHVEAPASAVTIVHFHGNAEQLSDLIPLAWTVKQAGLGFFAVEYPGYGMAFSDQATETALYAAADTALRFLRDELHVPASSVVLQGQSLGTGVAVEMARRGYGARLALITPYTSIVDLAAVIAPFVPARLLVRDRFDNAAKAPNLRLPVFIVHGTDDEVVPTRMGEQLSRLFPHATIRLETGAHHNDLLDRSSVTSELLRFAAAGQGKEQAPGQ